jgi:hypothetical protein
MDELRPDHILQVGLGFGGDPWVCEEPMSSVDPIVTRAVLKRGLGVGDVPDQVTSTFSTDGFVPLAKYPNDQSHSSACSNSHFGILEAMGDGLHYFDKSSDWLRHRF